MILTAQFLFPGEIKACVADRGWNYPHPPSPGRQTGVGRVYGGPGVLGKEAAAVAWSSSDVMLGQLTEVIQCTGMCLLWVN